MSSRALVAHLCHGRSPISCLVDPVGLDTLRQTMRRFLYVMRHRGYAQYQESRHLQEVGGERSQGPRYDEVLVFRPVERRQAGGKSFQDQRPPLALLSPLDVDVALEFLSPGIGSRDRQELDTGMLTGGNIGCANSVSLSAFMFAEGCSRPQQTRRLCRRQTGTRCLAEVR